MILDPNLKESVSPENELILYCARSYIDEEIKAQIQSLIQNGIEWEYLTQFAIRHRLINLVYYQLNRICPESIPEDVLENLRGIYRESAKSNLMLTGELFKVCELLESNGIKAVPYKGPSLALQAYKNLTLREFNDLDIFVSKSDVLKVKDLLKSNGYSLYYNLDYINSSFYLNTQREYAFINDKTGIVVEIHWNFHGTFLSLPAGYNCLYDDLDTFKFNSFTSLSLKTENLILILSIHCANHDWDSLSWLCDIYELIKANDNIDWNYLMETAEKLGVKRIFLVNMLLVTDLWELTVPAHVLTQINSDKSVNDLMLFIERKIFFEDEVLFTFFKKAVFDFKKRESRMHGIKDVIRTSLIPTYIDFVDIQLPVFLYPLYYIMRPVLLFRRLGLKSVHSNMQK